MRVRVTRSGQVDSILPYIFYQIKNPHRFDETIRRFQLRSNILNNSETSHDKISLKTFKIHVRDINFVTCLFLTKEFL